jgi:hypothetical protein
MSNIDDKLDTAWRAASRELPPATLDDSIRAAARRAVSAGPSRARHMRSWPLAAAAVVAVLAVAIIQLTPPEQMAPTIVADSSPTPREQDATPTPAAPAIAPAPLRPAAQTPSPAPARVDKRRAEAPAGTAATDMMQPAPERTALKSKLEAPAPEVPATVGRAEPFPAAPAESGNAVDAAAAPPPPPAVAAASKPAPASGGAMAVAAPRAPHTNEAPATAPSPLAKATAEGERAKDAAPRPPDEWIKLIRHLKTEGRTEEAAKELTAFRAAYKERADTLLPADLREAK